MKRKIRNIILVLGGIVLLRGALGFLIPYNTHVTWIRQQNLDPAIMFYTESEEALKAGRVVKARISK